MASTLSTSIAVVESGTVVVVVVLHVDIASRHYLTYFSYVSRSILASLFTAGSSVDVCVLMDACPSFETKKRDFNSLTL